MTYRHGSSRRRRGRGQREATIPVARRGAVRGDRRGDSAHLGRHHQRHPGGSPPQLAVPHRRLRHRVREAAAGGEEPVPEPRPPCREPQRPCPDVLRQHHRLPLEQHAGVDGEAGARLHHLLPAQRHGRLRPATGGHVLHEATRDESVHGAGLLRRAVCQRHHERRDVEAGW